MERSRFGRGQIGSVDSMANAIKEAPMNDVSLARPEASWLCLSPIMTYPDDDDDDDDAQPDDDEDERNASAYPRWSSRVGFGSPEWWSGH
jgi:hypothetical protein